MTGSAPRQTTGQSSAVSLYIAAVAVVAIVALASSWVVTRPPTDFVALGTLVVLGVLSVWLREQDVGAKVTFSFLSIIVIASVVLIGPVGSAIVGATSMALQRGRTPAHVRFFNASMSALLGVAGGQAYLLAGGEADLLRLHGPAALLLHIGGPLMVADVTQMLLNAALLAGIVRLDTGVPFRRFFVQMVSNSGVAYIGYGFIGFLFVILWVPADVGPFSAVLILAPLFVARWAFVQFGEEQRAHERTLSALVTAVETKDPYAAGHSARIARLAEWMAEPLSIGAQDVQALRFAAMLHDVGKVGVPTRLLRRPRSGASGAADASETSHTPWSLSATDLDAMRQHPRQGVELVRGIDFLQESLEGILHHHERWDGQGYPDGLAGPQIPLFSRVIAVADAFDAFTTDRPDRPGLAEADALAELRARAGRQFDPAVVEAVCEAVGRHDWSVAEIPEGRYDAMRGYLDHDHPPTWEWVSQVDGVAHGMGHGQPSPVVRTDLRASEPHEVRLS